MDFIKYLIIAIAILFAADICFAQEKNETKLDVVHLKNGEKIEGVIIDVFHDNYVDIVDTKRQKIRIIYRDIQSIVYGDDFQGKLKYNKRAKSQLAYHIPGKKMYYNIMLDLHMGRGRNQWVEPGRGLSFSTGYRFSRKTIVGIGAGIDTYDFNFRNALVPVFAEYRYEFLDRSFTPFATMRAGYGIPVGQNGGWNAVATNKTGGYFLNPIVGIRLGTKKKGHFHFALGWKIQDYAEEGVEFYSGPNGQWLESVYRDNILFSRMTLNAGLMF